MTGGPEIPGQARNEGNEMPDQVGHDNPPGYEGYSSLASLSKYWP